MFFFLYILVVVVLIPLGEGFLFALLLREFYRQNLPAEDDDHETVEEIGEVEPTLPESEDLEDIEEEPSGQPENIESETSEPEPNVVEPETPEPIEEQIEKSPKKEQQEENPPKTNNDLFDDLGLLPKSFKVDNIIDDMLGTQTKETPSDLSSRIEEDGEIENRFENFEELDDEDSNFDDDILERMRELTGETDSSLDEPIDFEREVDNDALSEDSKMPLAISPLAAELLGEDFDFDSLLKNSVATDFSSDDDIPPETSTTETPANDTLSESETESVSPTNSDQWSQPNDDIIVREFDGGVFQIESGFSENNSDLIEQLTSEPPIISSFPAEMISRDIIESDNSDEAKKYSFVEESRPMFVRKKRKKTD